MFIFLAVIVFIIVLGLLVLAHELGHFIVAKKSGMQVDEFGIGFPPRLFGIKKGETLYSINLIPLGGFVKILGENNEYPENPRSFVNKPFWPRFFTLVAGVVMNFVLAWVLVSIGLGIGLPTVVYQGDVIPAHATLSKPVMTVLQVSQGSPAEQAGIQGGDQILSVDGRSFTSVDSLIAYVKSREGNTVDIRLRRGDQNLEVNPLARKNASADQGAVGIDIGNVGRLKYAWYVAPWAGLQASWQIISGTAQAFWGLVSQGQGLSQLGGPVKIAAMTGQVTKLGFVYILQFAALLSVNLGIINIIPFPALDGGRVLFLIIEKIRGKRNNQAVENWVNTIGFALLIILVIIISFRDVGSLIHK